MIYYYFTEIADVDKENALIFPSDTNQLSSFYSTGNTVSIKFVKPSLNYPSFNGIRLKAEKVKIFAFCPNF